MSEGFQYETELIDHMSAPAHHEGEALAHLAEQATHTEDAIRKLGESHRVAAHWSLEAKGFFKDFSGSLVPEIALGELAAEAVKSLGEAAFEGAEKLADLTIEGVKFAAEMSEFKENAITAYSVVQGTAEEGEKTFAAIDQLGRDVHMPVERAHELAESLMQQGLENTREVEAAVQAVSDLQRVGMGRGADRLQTLIERSLAMGHLQVQGRALAGTGVQLPALMRELATSLHKPVEEIKADLKAGTIDAETGIAAIERTFAKSKIHEVAAKKFTIADLVVDLKNDVRGLFQDVDASPMLGSLSQLDWAFQQITGSTGGLKQQVTSAFTTIIQWIAPVIDAVTIFGLDVEIGFLKAELATKPLLADLKKMQIDGQVVYWLGEGIGFAAEHMAKLAITTAWVVGELASLAEHGSVQGQHAGTGFVDGLMLSLVSGQGQAGAAGRDLMGAAVAGANERAKIHSPSRVTEEMGGYLTEGLERGIAGGAGDVHAAFGDAVDVDAPRTGGGGGHTTVDVGGLHAHVTVQGGTLTPEEIKRSVTEALVDVTDQFRIELGAGVAA